VETEKKLVMEKEDFIFGTRAIIEAISSGRFVERVLIRKGLDNELSAELFQLIKQNDIPYQMVPVEKLNRVTRKNHQGVLALLSAVEFFDLEMILPGLYEAGKDPLLLILDQITDVRNLGAIIRSAECGGVHCIVIPEKGMARIGSDAVKTSAGAIYSLPVCKVKSINSLVRYLKNSGVKIIAATEKAAKIYTEANMNCPLAIIMGAEDKGISPALLQMCDEQLKIPLYGKIQSLNVSVAAGLMIYEAVRQRNQI
jgi:23S rRNA (guanosine2251-2'-O)-methyltransferase